MWADVSSDADVTNCSTKTKLTGLSFLLLPSYQPLVCGEKECPYDNFCIADLAGYSQDQCATPSDCPVPEGACTADINSVACGATFCVYDNQSCADLVFDSDECLPYLVVNDEPYVGYYDRACRANGSKGDFDVEETDLNTCREKCTDDEKCKGYEYSDREMHRR